MGNTPACIQKSITIYRELSSNIELLEHVIFDGHHGSHCFQLRLLVPKIITSGTKLKTITHISISVPGDACGNRGPSHNEPEIPETIETALFHGENIVYIDEIDYSDVCRFSSVEELIVEIRRIINYV